MSCDVSPSFFITLFSMTFCWDFLLKNVRGAVGKTNRINNQSIDFFSM